MGARGFLSPRALAVAGGPPAESRIDSARVNETRALAAPSVRDFPSRGPSPHDAAVKDW